MSDDRTGRRRFTLATRIALLGVAVAVITAVLAGGLAIGLIRNGSSADQAARQTLRNLADVSQSVAADGPTGGVARKRLTPAFAALKIRTGYIGAHGRVTAAVPLVRRAVTPADVTAVLAGHAVSASRSVDGTTVLVEARPTGSGAVAGIVLVERRSDSTAFAENDRAVRRILLALVVAGAIAVLLGLLVAWRLARPLRRVAAAAHAMAAGDRAVAVPLEGPREVAEVGFAMNTLSGALAHSEARQRDFLLSVSHDLRTPLTAISGYAESLADGAVPPEEAGRVGAVMLAEARRLDRMVGDLLDLARLDAEDLRIEAAPVDLVELVQGAGRVWAARCEQAGVRFGLEAPAGPVVVTTDAARVRQVLDGLFDNALRVTPAGAVVVLAAGVATGPGGWTHAVLEVRDGGPGLTDEDLAVAFRQGVLHQRYRGVRQVGTGFGLAIVHRLVTRLGGTVEAGHAQEGGARFTVRLPFG